MHFVAFVLLAVGAAAQNCYPGGVVVSGGSCPGSNLVAVYGSNLGGSWWQCPSSLPLFDYTAGNCIATCPTGDYCVNVSSNCFPVGECSEGATCNDFSGSSSGLECSVYSFAGFWGCDYLFDYTSGACVTSCTDQSCGGSCGCPPNFTCCNGACILQTATCITCPSGTVLCPDGSCASPTLCQPIAAPDFAGALFPGAHISEIMLRLGGDIDALNDAAVAAGLTRSISGVVQVLDHLNLPIFDFFALTAVSSCLSSHVCGDMSLNPFPGGQCASGASSPTSPLIYMPTHLFCNPTTSLWECPSSLRFDYEQYRCVTAAEPCGDKNGCPPGFSCNRDVCPAQCVKIPAVVPGPLPSIAPGFSPTSPPSKRRASHKKNGH